MTVTWPNATEFTNAVIGVDNKPAYTNFTDIFDNSANDAKFIWSTNVILDNEVIVTIYCKVNIVAHSSKRLHFVVISCCF